MKTFFTQAVKADNQTFWGFNLHCPEMWTEDDRNEGDKVLFIGIRVEAALFSPVSILKAL